MRLQTYGKNQTLLILPDKKVFFSYSTPVAAIVDGHCYQTIAKHSQTTTKHIRSFFGQDQETIKKDQVFFDNLIT